ncbi:class I SAM-dependent methyltransferase [Nocardia salmonicida]|uniref:class I SAM-dependent DNA methyltransferase n=1 Tax=Nocardia salmonicida TaxID=53431 RepID=UPI00340B8C25
MYEADFAEIYDHIHRSRGKDYAAEAAELARLIRERNPGAASVLDVACGTGGHLLPLRQQFDRVEGLELSEDMLALAQTRLAGIRLHRGDMREFRLDSTYDAIVCMFSSIGYLRTTAELDRTLNCFARHLNPGGVIVIESWVFPEAFLPGYVSADIARTAGRTIARFSHSVREGNATRMEVHYLDATESGIRHLTDAHQLTLFTRDEYEAAFDRASCKVNYLENDKFPRGVFVGVL